MAIPKARAMSASKEYKLGNSYFIGMNGKSESSAKAIYWWKKSATQGNANAENGLGRAYSSGRGVPQDYAKAAYWYKKAAVQGYSDAENNLGLAYFHGPGGRQKYSKAIYWFKKGIGAGVP